ncbi:TPA: flavodoxin FldB, partial [Escherichia coli]
SGVKFIGFWPIEGYEFTSPKPLTDDGKHFVGLALDEVNQFEESDERLSQWCMQILREIEENL